MTTYTKTYDLPTIKRGDTLRHWRFWIDKPETSERLVPAAVCMQLRDRRGEHVATFDTEIEQDGTILVQPLPASVTKEIAPGLYYYDIELTLDGGVVRTYIEGTLEVEKDVSQCQTEP